MSNIPKQDVEQAHAPLPAQLDQLQQIFTHLRAVDVEQFTQAYQLWSLQHQIELLQLQVALLEQDLRVNKEDLELAQPSPLALSALVQLQAKGVNDIELLDRMCMRGELWLDQSMQLLEQCERMDMIQGDYTQWCEHALEGAYDWMISMSEEEETADASPTGEAAETPYDGQTEKLLLRKLLSEEDEQGDATTIPPTSEQVAATPVALAEHDSSPKSASSETVETSAENAPESSEPEERGAEQTPTEARPKAVLDEVEEAHEPVVTVRSAIEAGELTLQKVSNNGENRDALQHEQPQTHNGQRRRGGLVLRLVARLFPRG